MNTLKSHIVPRLSVMAAAAAVVAAGFAPTATRADDTEALFIPPDVVLGDAPNILFVLDTRQTMKEWVTGFDESSELGAYSPLPITQSWRATGGGPPRGAGGPYRGGPGADLEVLDEGRADLGRMPTVQTTGTVWLPGAGEVEVRGLTTDAAAERIAAALADGGPPPRILVRVREYHSQFVWVRGAVRRPGRRALRPGTRLVDAVLDAGGFAPGATGRVVVERAAGTFEDGSARLALRFSAGAPTPEELSRLALPLRTGDVVIAVAQSWVRVDGVSRPGRYPVEEGMTVSRLVEQAAFQQSHPVQGEVVLPRIGGVELTKPACHVRAMAQPGER